MVLDFRRATMRPAARIVPLPVHSQARLVQTVYRARGLTPDDVVTPSFPKSGSTWLRFVVATIATRQADVNFTNLSDLSPPLGRHGGAPRLIGERGRFIKTHERYEAFPRFRSRALYVVRDGRDVAVSLYHFLRRWNIYTGPFEEYLPAFLAGRVVNYGSWQEHVSSWYGAARRRPDAIAVVRYEDLLGDRGAEALGAALARIGWKVPDEAVEQALRQNSFERMRRMEAETGVRNVRSVGTKDPSIPFVRRGKAGQWREMFSDEQLRAFDAEAGEALALAGYAERAAR
jgi:hypothetical protein